MDMLKWAENEVALAKERERAVECDRGGEYNFAEYGCACYDSALKAFKSLLEDGHSGMSIGFTKDILVRLILTQPLTPIFDREEDWISFGNNATTREPEYWHKRYSSLVKTVKKDGSVVYSDRNRVRGKMKDSDAVFYCGLLTDMINEVVPITFPYMPPVRPYVVETEEFLLDTNSSEDFDLCCYGPIKCPDGETMDIYKYYHDDQEISREEYEKLKPAFEEE